jgi:hypothetical protein
MTPAEQFLSRVTHRKVGAGRWVFNDPTTTDTHPSGSLRELDDGRLLIHMFNGTSTEAVLSAVGLEFSDLFPDLPERVGSCGYERRPFMPSDVFEIARHEIGVAAVIACDMAKTTAISEPDRLRLLEASARLGRIAEAAYGK